MAPPETGLTLPSGVGLLPRGEPGYFTQRQKGRPMVDCMFAALCTPLSYMGLDLPGEFVARLRTASGVPIIDGKGDPQGTTTAASDCCREVADGRGVRRHHLRVRRRSSKGRAK